MIFLTRRPVVALTTVLLVSATAMWAVTELLGTRAWVAVGGFAGAIIGTEYSDRRNYGSWVERRALAAAVHEHTDPGPERRAVVDQAARVYLTVHGRAWWVSGLLLATLGAACLLVAALRDDPGLIAPGAVLAALAVGSVVVLRRALDRADRWLVDPPAPGPTGNGG